ncbi:MAG: MFS transporter, partial [Chloroflexi bacterium]|nr:MFS transporter [Chloroflexota bacterium]
LGVLLSMGGLGAVVGSLIVASIPGGQRGRVWMISVAVIGVAMLVFAVNTHYWVALACAVAIGIGQAGYLSLGSVLLQAYTDDEYRGRALSVYMMQYGLMSFGTLLVSLVANAIGPQIAVGLASLALLAITAAQFIARTPLSRLR